MVQPDRTEGAYEGRFRRSHLTTKGSIDLDVDLVVVSEGVLNDMLWIIRSEVTRKR